jgi:hypothetical protein
MPIASFVSMFRRTCSIAEFASPDLPGESRYSHDLFDLNDDVGQRGGIAAHLSLTSLRRW